MPICTDIEADLVRATRYPTKSGSGGEIMAPLLGIGHGERAKNDNKKRELSGQLTFKNSGVW